MSLTFPFNAPGYIIETVPVASGTAFNVMRCPVAEYFRKQNAVDLCTSSWCNLDYPLAELTGEKLVRTRTLVKGDHHCDFRLSERRNNGCLGMIEEAIARSRNGKIETVTAGPATDFTRIGG